MGKTTLARIAAQNGWDVIDLKAWAKAAGAVVGHDHADGADIIDTDLLAAAMPPRSDRPQLIEGHLSHLLPVDAIWVVRCDPRLLAPRLHARGYPAGKILENLEAEALDIILMEALDQGVPVIQRDSSSRNPQELWAALVAASVPDATPVHLEEVDWTDQLPFSDRAPGKPKEDGPLGRHD